MAPPLAARSSSHLGCRDGRALHSSKHGDGAGDGHGAFRLEARRNAPYRDASLSIMRPGAPPRVARMVYDRQAIQCGCGGDARSRQGPPAQPADAPGEVDVSAETLTLRVWCVDGGAEEPDEPNAFGDPREAAQDHAETRYHQGDYPAMQEIHVRDVSGALLVFDVETEQVPCFVARRRQT